MANALDARAEGGRAIPAVAETRLSLCCVVFGFLHAFGVIMSLLLDVGCGGVGNARRPNADNRASVFDRAYPSDKPGYFLFRYPNENILWLFPSLM